MSAAPTVTLPASHAWPIDEIAAALGGELTTTSPSVWTVCLGNRSLGTRLELQLAPAHGAVQLIPERDKKTGPWTIGKIVYYGVSRVAVDATSGVVRFRTNEDPPIELLVTALGQFCLTAGIDADQVKPPPVAAPLDPEPITLIGRLARPRYSEQGKSPFWCAGLAVRVDGREQPVWHNLKAWGSLAVGCKAFAKGQPVRATGKRKEERYLKNGVLMADISLVLTAIEVV
jgi:hypothetical protein